MHGGYNEPSRSSFTHRRSSISILDIKLFRRNQFSYCLRKTNGLVTFTEIVHQYLFSRSNLTGVTSLRNFPPQSAGEIHHTGYCLLWFILTAYEHFSSFHHLRRNCRVFCQKLLSDLRRIFNKMFASFSSEFDGLRFSITSN